MKKVLFAIAALSTAASAAPFNGFYVGAELGALMAKLDNKANVGTRDYTSSKTKKNSAVYGVFAGYNKSFNNMFAGAELGLIAQGSELKVNPTVAGASTAEGKYKRGLTVSVAPRVGYKFNDTTAAFFQLAVNFSKDEVSYKLNSQNADKKKVSVVKFAPAIGVEKAFGNVSLRGSVGYEFGNKIAIDTANTSQTTKGKFEASQKGFVVKAGVSYNF